MLPGEEHVQTMEGMDQLMSNKVQLNLPAPDFELHDFNGRTVRLSDYQGKKHVVLVFNRGFL